MTGHRVALVVSDVDGTLVTTDKTLTPRSRAAVASFAQHSITFTIISSRPPFGLRMLVGVSANFDRLTQCAEQTKATLGGVATVSRSQPYYLDVNAPQM